ncbi:hypothetical protein [Geomesophilobacter sediminis]|uniref:Uncharacterized protein n=1 Tax=Geomesophilobacter sediminis TaxID=2798584 RepID=A0A8J7JCM7_9BACT|nr:hypothetical protein [Geomesophilobacter sediminis]MBJ6725076.1 hypothetical protein [Geomesophilobacter sediminis]
MRKLMALFFALLVLTAGTAAWASFGALTLSANHHVPLQVSNDAGIKFDYDYLLYGNPQGTYYLKADGGGLNQLHITTDTSNLSGQVTTLNSPTTTPSGTFYLPTTGGRGYNDDVILMVSVKGPVPDDFAVTITATGYTWTPSTSVPTPSASDHQQTLSQTFYKSDLIYAASVYKPGPGTTWTLPLFYGQNTGDSSTAEYYMFIDLGAGNISGSYIDQGAVKVDYAFTDLSTTASFNVFSWCLASNQGEGINWTQQTSGTGSSGYTVNYTP